MLPTEWTVLIAADNEPLRRRLLESFTLDGHNPRGASTCDQVMVATDQVAPTAIIVAELEHPSAMTRLLTDLRREISPTHPPVLVAIARGPSEADRVRPLEAGADAVVPHESGYQELRATVHALVRQRVSQAPPRVVVVGSLRIDLRSRAVTRSGHAVDLTAKEYELLRALAAEPGRVFTKEELLREVWGFKEIGATRTLDSHACRLRRKLERPGLPPLVQNVWGIGYRLVDAVLHRTEPATLQR